MREPSAREAEVELATLDLWEAIEARVQAGIDLPIGPGGTAILDRPQWQDGPPWPRTYRGETEPNERNEMPPPGYLLLGTVPEDPGGFLNGQDGTDAELTVHCWADTISNANRLARWFVAQIRSAPLVVAGHTVWNLVITKGRESPDPSGTAWQVPIYLTWGLLDA